MWSEEEKWIERKRGIWAEKVLIIRIFSIRMLNIRRVIRKISKMKNLIKITEIWARMHNGKISLNLFLEYLLVKVADYATPKYDCESSGHITLKYTTLLYWLFWPVGS